MPSFAFWKSSKQDESKSPLLSDAAVTDELSVIIPGASKAVDLNPGNQDSGVFLFDEDAQEIPGDQTPISEPTSSLPVEASPVHREDTEPRNQDDAPKVNVSLMDVEEPSSHPQTPALIPEQPSHVATNVVRGLANGGEKTVALPENDIDHRPQADSASLEAAPLAELCVVEDAVQEVHISPSPSRPVSLVPKESGPTLSVEKRPITISLGKIETNLHDRDSAVYMSDSEGSPARSRPSSIASNEHSLARTRVSSLSKPTTASPSIARLQRPAELNLGFTSAQDPAKPKSELDMRYDLIRNSKTRSKAALRSPTQLLQDRLNMSPKKKDVEEKARVFTPPRGTVNGCLLPGPGAQAEAFTSTAVRAKTEAGERPAWWCKFDKLVVFDGIEQQSDGGTTLRTRTSKGLSIARRLGDLETVVIPLDCAHCHEMLNRHDWKYDIRVCKRSVCWDCKERCKWEYEQEKMATAATPRTDANRERADSMLQDEQSRSHNLTKEIAV
ncbi:hypothetical protein SLS59_001043 [Nothophoma quercina]|uniref:Uncharacterized protein n=1 Tax=Nothophoma quercina TaxID=749835 RepID=A0ABR3RZW1_9PLEO